MQELLNILKEKLLSLPVTINANIFFLGKSLKLKTFKPLTSNTVDINHTKHTEIKSNTEDDDKEVIIIDALDAFSI